MDDVFAHAIVQWRYPQPYDVYNFDLADQALLIDPHHQYYSVAASATDVIGFCCFGREAQVPGGPYDPTSGILDVGLGLRPELTSQGWGQAFVEAVLQFGQQQHTPTQFRLTVATWNQRARRVYEQVGFRAGVSFTSVRGFPFILMLRSEQIV